MAGSIDRLVQLDTTRYKLRAEMLKTSAGERHEPIGSLELDEIRNIGKSGDIDVILQAEHFLLLTANEIALNSPAMRRSLDMAVTDVNILRNMVDRVCDPETYRKIDLDHERQKDRIGQLPRDSARQIFKSHIARLLNQDKAPLDLIDKKIIDARRANIRTAEKQYIALQQIALGITPEPPDKFRGAGLGI